MTRKAGNPYEVFASRISEYVQDHLGEEIAIDDLAAMVRVSKYHLNRLFQVTTGFQLGEFIQRRRLQHAYSLLSEGTCSVIEASVAVGYESQSSFSRAFLKAFSCKPSEVKRGTEYLWKTPNTLKKACSRDSAIQAEMLELPSRRLQGLYGAGFKDNSFSRLALSLFDELASRLRNTTAGAVTSHYIGVSLESPWQGDQNESRFFVGVDGEGLSATLGLAEYVWSAGQWAMFLHHGSYRLMWQTISRIYAGWVIPEGIRLKDDAIVQVYLNNPRTTPEVDLRTALYFPLQS